MFLASIKEKIKCSPVWKARIHRMMFCNARPRVWVKWFVNPLVFRHGKGAVIRRRTILNVSPVNQFRVGEKSTIEDYTVIDNGVGDVIIGNHTRIGLRSTIIGPVQVGNHAILGQNLVMSGLYHNYENPDRPIHQQGVTPQCIHIEDDSCIYANVTITSGVTIGRHAVVGAGSVVTKDIPPYSMAVGNPAKVIKKFDFSSGKWIRVE